MLCILLSTFFVCGAFCLFVKKKKKLKLCFKESFVSTKALHDSCVCALLCLTLLWPHRPGFPIHGIFLARILEWVAISSCRGSSWPRDWTHVELTSSALASRFFTTESSGNPSYKILNLDNWGSRYVCIVVIGILELIEIPSNIFCSYLINAVLM